MADTTWVLADHTGKAQTPIENASERRFTAHRNAGKQGRITLGHDDREARKLFELLRNGVPQLRYYRGMRDGSKPLRLSAYLTSIREELDEDGESKLVATFKDPFARIYGDGSGQEPGRILLAPADFVGVDQGTIAWSLIDLLNQVGTAGDTGLRQGTIEATTARDRSYVTGKNVGEAIEQLTQVVGGFDFEVLPLDPTTADGKLGEFAVYASQGSDRADLIWGYGKGTFANVRKAERNITPPINRVHMVTSDGLESIQDDGLSRGRQGEWAVSLSAPNDVVQQATLDGQAEDALRPDWVRVTTFRPDPNIGPQPFDDFWLGDTGRFKAREGAFEESFVPRVNGIVITENEGGDEDYELETEEVLDG